MNDYYSEKLSAEQLQRCYEIASPRIHQYLQAEIQHVISRLHPGDTILELGCGYGRILRELVGKARRVVGMDTSSASLKMAQTYLDADDNILFLQMDAAHLAFPDGTFDVTLCLQNGLSAFKVDQLELIRESIRATRLGGKVLLSSYSAKFWDVRLEWFDMQAKEGLLGEIDWGSTGDGVIVCKDGFRATTVLPDDFIALTSQLGLTAQITEVDKSSVFCEVVKS
ncbi:SAM-dependent methyltransferase [candidate division LCP-89 bacterium B3_LCP]|uniref:SAM-dependent methyltransferase n=1 Tax=candidate division LCP-89 bacterium B3_LCP TaxID=2012998 RepID=A0A532UZ09_UNCL8|nr:MAG: SAM-dependent methyltransferase [candidate division LCP-89 bacterium B3_LCP]